MSPVTHGRVNSPRRQSGTGSHGHGHGLHRSTQEVSKDRPGRRTDKTEETRVRSTGKRLRPPRREGINFREKRGNPDVLQIRHTHTLSSPPPRRKGTLVYRPLTRTSRGDPRQSTNQDGNKDGPQGWVSEVSNVRSVVIKDFDETDGYVSKPRKVYSLNEPDFSLESLCHEGKPPIPLTPRFVLYIIERGLDRSLVLSSENGHGFVISGRCSPINLKLIMLIYFKF